MTSQTAIQIDGVVPVIPVPFLPDEQVDVESLARVVDFTATNEAAAMCLPAYGSEFYKLSEAEREKAVGVAIEANRHRVPLIAQANHGSAAVAARFAKRYEQMGAEMISIAIPRQFSLRNSDVLRYLGTVADAITIPMLVQDFNPGGQTIGADMIDALNRHHANIRYVKLEEPMMIGKLLAIREAVGDRVGVLEGWGGYYMLELIPHGICGIMPGVPLLEPLDHVYRLRTGGQAREAMAWMGRLLPFINYTLQNFELFLQVEKRLLVKRGLIRHATLRDATCTPVKEELEYIELLCDHVLAVIADCRKAREMEKSQ